MDNSKNSFLVSINGSWPYETYSITPSSAIIDSSVGFLPYEGITRAVYNAHTTYISSNFLTVYNANTAKSDYFASIKFSNSAVLMWNISSQRQSSPDIYPFFYFYVKTPSLNKSVHLNFNSALIYPSKIGLHATNISKTGNFWTLQTSAVLIKPFFNTYNSVSSHKDAVFFNQNYSNLNNSITSFLPIPSSGSLNVNYNISAVKIKGNQTLINFVPHYNPTYTILSLENSSTQIRPESIFFTYSFQNNIDKNLIYKQLSPDIHPSLFNNFKSSFLQSNSTPAVYTFSHYVSGSVFYKVSSVLDFSNNSYAYYNNNTYDPTSLSNINVFSGVPGTALAVKYIAESNLFDSSQESCISTLSSVSVSNDPYVIGTNLATNSTFNNIKWITKYPPHYYSYIVNATQNGSIVDSNKLNFFISSKSSFIDTYTRSITPIIISSLGNYSLNIGSYSFTEFIKYEIENVSPDIISTLSAAYGSTPYSLIDSPWVATGNKNLIIKCTDLKYSEFKLPLKISLSSVAGILETPHHDVISFEDNRTLKSNHVNFIPQLLDKGPGYVVLDISSFNSEKDFPGINLSDSNISWCITPSSDNILISKYNTVSSEPLNIGESYIFNPLSPQSVKVSGFGSQSISIQVSSEKYGLSNPYITDSYINDSIPYTISLSADSLSNLNPTRYINISAKLFNGDTETPIPSNMEIKWSWKYDDTPDPDSKFVKATVNNRSYAPGSPVLGLSGSSITLFITPPEAAFRPSYHNITLLASVIIGGSLIEQTHSFTVDEFPSTIVFGANFNISYNHEKNTPVFNTANNLFTFTRPINSLNNFFVSINQGIISTYNPSLIRWVIQDKHSSRSLSITGTSSINLIATVSGMSSISLILENSMVPGWTLPHNLKTSCDFNIVSADYFKPLTLSIYPTQSFPRLFPATSSSYSIYGPQVSLNNSNVKIAHLLYGAPFSDNTNGKQDFNVEINKENFSAYNLYMLDSSGTETYLTTLTSNKGIISIPYTTDLFSVSGQQIVLRIYNQIFPLDFNEEYSAPTINGKSDIVLQNAGLATATLPMPLNEFGIPILPPDQYFTYYNPRLVKPPIHNYTSNSNVLVSYPVSSNSNPSSSIIFSENNTSVFLSVSTAFTQTTTPSSVYYPDTSLPYNTPIQIPVLINEDISYIDYKISYGDWVSVISIPLSSKIYKNINHISDLIELKLGEGSNVNTFDKYKSSGRVVVTPVPHIFAQLNSQSVPREVIFS